MKVGDMVEINTGHTGIIVDVESMYPGHPDSPLRSVEVMWTAGQPDHTFARQINQNISSVSVFAVKKVISHGED